MDRINALAGAVDTKTLLMVLFAVAPVEICSRTLPGSGTTFHLLILGFSRALEGATVIGVLIINRYDLRLAGLRGDRIRSGFGKGITWSAVFGGSCFLVFACLALSGWQPLRFVTTALPAGAGDLLLFFIVGGMVSPVAEELFFRGILYGFLRRLGILPAVLLSTVAFVLAHLPNGGLLLVPAVGGILFAVSYEVEKNLVVPMTLHSLGNLSIFVLSSLRV